MTIAEYSRKWRRTNHGKANAVVGGMYKKKKATTTLVLQFAASTKRFTPASEGTRAEPRNAHHPEAAQENEDGDEDEDKSSHTLMQRNKKTKQGST